MTLGSNSKVYVSNENLTATQAYWVYCQNDDDEITLLGTAVVDDDFETGLKPGWNFVGPAV